MNFWRNLRIGLSVLVVAVGLLALLAAVNSAEHQVIVDSLSVKQQRVGLDLSVWYRLQPDPAASSAKPPKPSSSVPVR